MIKVLPLQFLLIFSITIFSNQAQAYCLDKVEANIQRIKEQPKNELDQYVGTGAIVAILAVAYTPVASVLFGLLGQKYVTNRIQLKRLKNLKRAIDESYTYQETGVIGKYLQRLHRKINKHLRHLKKENKLAHIVELSLEDVAFAVIENNENEKLCSAVSIRDYSRSFKIELD